MAKKNRSLQSGSKRSLFIDQSLQKFVSIRSSLFLRHLQNIKFELAKLIAFQPLQSVLQMSSTALLADFNAAVEVLNDSLSRNFLLESYHYVKSYSRKGNDRFYFM